MAPTGEHISRSVMFQRTHARLWLLSSSRTVKSLVSSWCVSGKASALDWISLVVFQSGGRMFNLLTCWQTPLMFSFFFVWSYCKTLTSKESFCSRVVNRKQSHSSLSFSHRWRSSVRCSGGERCELTHFLFFPFVLMQRRQLCLQRCVFCRILVVWFMFADKICVVTPSSLGWGGVMLVQYCVHPEVEIILFAIIAAKHLISHWTFSHTNIPAVGFKSCVCVLGGRRGGGINCQNDTGLKNVQYARLLFGFWLSDNEEYQCNSGF